MLSLRKISSVTILFCFFCQFAWPDVGISPASEFPLRNLRESESALIKNDDVTKIIDLYARESVDQKKLDDIFSDTSINTCSSKIITSIKNELVLSDDKDVLLALLAERFHNRLDDVSVNLIVKMLELKPLVLGVRETTELSQEDQDTALSVLKTQLKSLKDSTGCFEDQFRLFTEVLNAKKPALLKNLKQIHRLALKKELIDSALFKRMEKLRFNKVHEWPMTLNDYSRKLNGLRESYPLKEREAAELVTKTKFRQKVSWRTALYEKYNATQIVLLANIVSGLKTRLESKSIAININYDDRETEVIALSAMEKFRFILKLLRKELATINNSNLLGGKKATYYDLITAAYETGFLKALDLEQFAALQEIWNPTKTPKEKAMYWTKTFGGVAAVLLPPPYGFVSVLVIMLIDQQVKEAPVEKDPDDDLF